MISRKRRRWPASRPRIGIFSCDRPWDRIPKGAPPGDPHHRVRDLLDDRFWTALEPPGGGRAMWIYWRLFLIALRLTGRRRQDLALEILRGLARGGRGWSGSNSRREGIHRYLQRGARITVSSRSGVGADERLLTVFCSSPSGRSCVERETGFEPAALCSASRGSPPSGIGGRERFPRVAILGPTVTCRRSVFRRGRVGEDAPACPAGRAITRRRPAATRWRARPSAPIRRRRSSMSPPY